MESAKAIRRIGFGAGAHPAKSGHQRQLRPATSKLGIEGEAIARNGPELVRMLTSQTNPLFHILQNDLIFRIYLSNEGARSNQYITNYTKISTCRDLMPIPSDDSSRIEFV